MAKSGNLILIIPLALFIIGSFGFNPSVKTSVGTIHGHNLIIPELSLFIEAYLGIPFAEPPVNNLRFKDPVPIPKNQSNDYDMDHLPPSCPQYEITFFEGFKGIDVWKLNTRMDEDCLYLNIWKPKNNGTSKRPVIVWIHGGGFNVGSTSVSFYDGSYLAGWTDSIVVTIQYRLGVFGFLYTGDDFAPGNAGLKDQALALKWVNEHIENFGGDKERITIAGESAGGASVGFLSLSPETSKLFRKAILMSGVPDSFWAFVLPHQAKETSLGLAERLGADRSDYEDVKEKLMTKSWQDVIKAQDLIPSSMAKINFHPTIDPKLIPEHPSVMIKKARHLKGKEMIISWTKEEGSMFLIFELLQLNKTTHPFDPITIDRDLFLDRLAGGFGINKNLEVMTKLYEPSEPNAYLKSLIDYYSDAAFRCPIDLFIAEAKIHKAKVFQLEYNHRTKNNAWPEWMGTEHAADLEMFFGLPIRMRNEFSQEDKILCVKYLDLLKEFIANDTRTSILNKWDEQNVFKLSYSDEEPDDRSSVCRELRELATAGYSALSGANTLDVGMFGIISLFITFIRSLI